MTKGGRIEEASAGLAKVLNDVGQGKFAETSI